MEDFCLYASILRLFMISVHCPTRRQVAPVLKSTFKFKILTPNMYCTIFPFLAYCVPKKNQVKAFWMQSNRNWNWQTTTIISRVPIYAKAEHHPKSRSFFKIGRYWVSCSVGEYIESGAGLINKHSKLIIGKLGH